MYEFLLIFGVILWLAIGFVYIRKPVASMYHPLTYYLMIHGLLFVVRPISAYYYGFDGLYIAYQFMPSMEEKNIVLAGADLGFVAFALASLTIGNMPFDMRNANTTTMSPKTIRAFLITCAICLPIGIYSLSSTLLGTSGEMELDLSTGIRYNVTGNGYFSDAQLMLGPICAVFAWVFRFKIWALIPFFIFVGAKASTGGRFPFVVAFLMLSLLYFYEKGKKWPDVRIIGPAIGILILFTAIGSNRQVIRNAFTGEEVATMSSGSVERPLESMDYGNMEFFEYLTYAIPGRSGTYGYFLDNLQVFTEPVPRVLWRGKPFGPPIQLYDLYAYGTPIGMTMSVPGEGWAQGGWLGIIIWCGLFGIFYGKIYALFVRGPKKSYQVAMFVVLMSSSIVTFRDGVLMTILKSSLFTLLPLAIWQVILLLDRSEDRVAYRKGWRH